MGYNAQLRPVQMQTASQFMHGSGPQPEVSNLPVPHAALLAGDFNASTIEEAATPEYCGLQDAFLVLGGRDGTEEGFTWGQQAPPEDRARFGCSRMDKILFCGGLAANALRPIGEGVKVWIEYPEVSDDDDEEGRMGEYLWVTDHLGLQGEFRIVV